MFVIPRTKHIESNMFDFPEPFRPVIELKLSSLSKRQTPQFSCASVYVPS